MGKRPGPTIVTLQQELEISRQLLRTIFDNINTAVLLVAPDTSIIFANKTAIEGSRMTHGREFRVGESIMSYRFDVDEENHRRFKANFEKALATRMPVWDEREMHFPTMSFWIRTEYTPVFTDEKPLGIVLHFHNVTDKKKAEDWNERQATILSQIAWSQAHETRQPVATLLGLISILDKESLSTENRQIITMLEQTVEKLEGVIRQNVISANLGSAMRNEPKSKD